MMRVLIAISLNFVTSGAIWLGSALAEGPNTEGTLPTALELKSEESKLLAEESRLLGEISGIAKPELGAKTGSADKDTAKSELKAALSPNLVIPNASTQSDVKPIKAAALAAGDARQSGGSGGIEITGAKLSARERPDKPAAVESAASLPAQTNAGSEEVLRLRSELEASKQLASQLQKELAQARNRLIVAETEVERLSNVLQDKNDRNLSRYTSKGSPSKNAKVMKAPPKANVSSKPPASAGQDGDMLIATVVVDKAHLRTGPGKDNSPLMTVSRGTRLAIETRSGNWYRVISPTGARAWVSSDVLIFGQGAGSSPTSTVRIRPVVPATK
ncbi:MAG: hypothetical protein DCC75_05155 [Proteobacteria bacterium]|nr:MAG: hypothetical protein DCC75_05155 [Pseudomonadota bacterium]